LIEENTGKLTRMEKQKDELASEVENRRTELNNLENRIVELQKRVVRLVEETSNGETKLQTTMMAVNMTEARMTQVTNDVWLL
jgi:chromosome segregation ATPase